MEYECSICGRRYADVAAFTGHILNDHKIRIREYYDKYLRKGEKDGLCEYCGKPTEFMSITKGYRHFCSAECRKKSPKFMVPEHTEYTCKVCGKVISAESAGRAISLFNMHIKKEHGIYSGKIYYDRYLRKEGEGRCRTCGKETRFISIPKGYDVYCNSGCYMESVEYREHSENARLSRLAGIRNTIKALADKISRKYSDFLKNDRLTNYDDVRTDPVPHKTVKNTEIVTCVDGTQASVKTEISSSRRQSDYLGTQTYVPVQEDCGIRARQAGFDDNIEAGDRIDATEWC